MTSDIMQTLSLKSEGRTPMQYQFAADFIAYNWPTHEHDANIKKFVELFDSVTSWDLQSLLHHAKDSSEIQLWLLSSSRCQALHNIFTELNHKINSYEDRIRKTKISYVSHVSESLNHNLTGRGPEQKLEAALNIQEKLLCYAFANSSATKLELVVAENLQAQLLDDGELSKIFHNIAFIYSKLQLFNYLQSNPTRTHPFNANSFTNNHNFICFNYLTSLKQHLNTDQIRAINLDDRFANLGAYLSVIPNNYTDNYDFSLLYHLIIKNFNVACSNLTVLTTSSIEYAYYDDLLNNLAYYIYENDFDILQQVKTWMYRCLSTTDKTIHKTKKSLQAQLSHHLIHLNKNPSSETEILISFDPRFSDTSFEKIRTNFSDNSDPLASTNIPSKLKFLADNIVRMGCQTRTVLGNIEVYPSFIRYINALKSKFSQEVSNTSKLFSTDKKNSPIFLLYISNLRSDDSAKDFEASIEGHRNRALINLAEITPGLEVIIMPANRSFLHHKQRTFHENILNLKDVINEITNITLDNGQDFYLSNNVRSKLFAGLSRPEQYCLIKQWIKESLNDLYLPENKPFEISPAARQQIACHFFKYTLTDKLLSTLNPYRYTTPCKDNIDRGAVHSMYYHIIKLIKDTHNNLENAGAPSELDRINIEALNTKVNELLCYDLHCAALQVKARPMNSHNFGLLIHALDGFSNGPYGFYASPAFPKSLKTWLDDNIVAESTTTSSLMRASLSPTISSPNSPNSSGSDSDKSEMMFLRSEDKIAAAERACFVIPDSTKIPAYVGKTASFVGNTPNLLLCAARNIKLYAAAASSALADGVKLMCLAYGNTPEIPDIDDDPASFINLDNTDSGKDSATAAQAVTPKLIIN